MIVPEKDLPGNIHYVNVTPAAATAWFALVARVMRHCDLSADPLTLEELEYHARVTFAEVARMIEGEDGE